MHLSYYFLCFLTKELQKSLIGYTLEMAHFQNKEEAYLVFSHLEKQFIIKFNNQVDFTSLSFSAEYSPNKKSVHPIFRIVFGRKVIDIVQHENDRSFRIEFEGGYTLLFKMYASRSNLVLFHQTECIELLNNNLALDKSIDITRMDKRREHRFSDFVVASGSIQVLFPGLDKTCIAYLNENGYDTMSIEKKWESIVGLLGTLQTSKFYIVKDLEGIVNLSFFSNGELLGASNSAIEASNIYERYASSVFYFNRYKKEAIQFLTQQLQKNRLYLKKVKQKFEEITNQTPYHHIGDILMANLYAIPKGSEQVTLHNFYTDLPIEIALKRESTPQKNAENYYRKGKNKKIEVAQIEKNINSKKEIIATLERQLESVLEIVDLKQLKNYTKEHKLNKDKVEKEKEDDTLFKRFEIEGFEILIGKSAKNNDVLTQKYSYKEDLWLHARDVAGSHVLIKYQSGKKFSKSVIEKAAQLAAFYSKRKSDTLCPVIFTPKKYVRKPKGALDGQVIVEREEVILVKPSDYSNLSNI